MEARLLAAAAREPNSPQPYRELAEEYAGSGRSASALWSYAEATARAPGDDSIRLKLAAVAAQLGHVPIAEAEFRQMAAGKTPAAAPARQELAGLLLATGRPAAALAALREAGPEAEVLRGRAHEGAGEAAAAAASYRHAGAAGDPEGFERLARLELASGHLTAAQEAVRALAGLRAARPSDLLLIAAIHAAAGTPRELDTALARLHTCLQLQPDSAEAHYQAALLLIRKGDRAAAADQLERAVQLDPNHAEARGRLADLLQAMGQTARAHRERALYDDLKDQPDRALAEFRLTGASGPPDDLERARITARAAAETDQLAAVTRQVRDELQRRPGDTGLMLELGLLYQQGGSRAALERLCRAWMALQPASGMPYWLLGRQAIGQLRAKDAIQLFETACAKNPERSDFCMALGLAYAAMSTPENLARARPWLEKAIALDPRAPGPHQQLGWMLEQAGDTEAARREYLQALDAQPSDTSALSSLVRVLGRRGRPEVGRRFAELAGDEEQQAREREQLAQRVRAHAQEAAPRVELARFLIRHGQLAAARNQLERAAEGRSAPASARQALTEVDRLLRESG
jgi:tetratricopeptide (TPR) repeat protein